LAVYWLDADACIQTKDERTGAYPFSRWENFWAYLSHQVDLGFVRCPKKVYDEVTKGWDDPLAMWFREREDRGLCEYPTPEAWECVAKISDFVMNRWGDRMTRPFLKGADVWVLAHAMSMGKDGFVVSHESKRQQNSIVKIPTVCYHLNIQKISIHEMLNRLKAKF
jgi:hypothetical protein